MRRTRSEKMLPVTVHLPERLIRQIDSLVKQKRYFCRADAIRMAIRIFLEEEKTYENSLP